MQFNQILFKVRCIIPTIMFLIIFFLFSGIYREYFDAFTGQHHFTLSRLKESSSKPSFTTHFPWSSSMQKLATLLTEEDYNLSIMVNLKFHFTILLWKLPLWYLQIFLFFQCSLYNFSVCLFFVWSHLLCSPAFSNGLLCIFPYILHKIPQHIFSYIILEYISHFILLSILLT